MPSPGIPTLKNALTFPYTVEGGFATSMKYDSEVNDKLATAMHIGWTSSSPTTPTTMETAISAEFSSYVQTSGPYGTGWQHLLCLGIGIDEEIAAWVSSWNGTVHTFTVTAASIESRIKACFPWSSNATDAIAQAVSQAFATYFEQEVG